jgi:hypothetical protein
MGITAQDFSSIIKSGKKENEYTSSPTINPQNFGEILKTTPEGEGRDWADVPIQAITNLPKSAAEFGKNIYEAVTHPLETAKGVLDLGAGTLHNITPRAISEWIDKADWNPEAKDRAVQTANAIGHLYKTRYGTSEGFKEALATDPVGVASDLATLMSGGTALATKTGLSYKAGQVASKLGMTPEVANVAEKVVTNLNPVTAATNVVSAVGKPLLGSLTGVGSENIANAAKAGFSGDKSFWNQLTGKAAINEPLDAARANLATMRQTRGNDYRSGMTNITDDKSVLNFDEINKALKETKDSVSFKGQTGAEIPTKVHEDLSNIINEWKKLDPAEYHTPEGLDFLKQKIGDYTQSIGYEHTNANRVGSDIYNSIKGTISNQAPKYAEVMKDYHEASDTIKEIEKALSLGNKASVDTAMRKLQSVTRNNVNTNYGQRLNLAQQLEKEGGRPFINALSGQAMSSPTARGLAGTVENLTALGGLVNPALLATLPFQTPKLVGTALYGGGKAAKQISKLAQKTGLSSSNSNAVANAVADMLQMINKTKEEE